MIGRVLWATVLAATLTPGARYYDCRWQFIARTRRQLDGRRCVNCGARGVVLNVHHRRAVSAGGNHHLWNLITLCQACHEAAHGRDLNRNGGIG